VCARKIDHLEVGSLTSGHVQTLKIKEIEMFSLYDAVTESGTGAAVIANVPRPTKHRTVTQRCGSNSVGARPVSARARVDGVEASGSGFKVEWGRFHEVKRRYMLGPMQLDVVDAVDQIERLLSTDPFDGCESDDGLFNESMEDLFRRRVIKEPVRVQCRIEGRSVHVEGLSVRPYGHSATDPSGH